MYDWLFIVDRFIGYDLYWYLDFYGDLYSLFNGDHLFYLYDPIDKSVDVHFNGVLLDYFNYFLDKDFGDGCWLDLYNFLYLFILDFLYYLK